MVRVVRDRAAAKRAASDRAARRRVGRAEPASSEAKATSSEVRRAGSLPAALRESRGVVLPIELPSARSGGLGWCEFVALAHDFLTFLLYMRGQMPGTYESLALDATNSRRRASATRNRSSRAFDDLHRRLETLFASLRATPRDQAGGNAEASRVCEFAVVFGASTRRPREAYVLASATAASEEPGSCAQPGEVQRGLAQKVNRELITAGAASAALGGSLKRRCKVHVLVRSGDRRFGAADFYENLAFASSGRDGTHATACIGATGPTHMAPGQVSLRSVRAAKAKKKPHPRALVPHKLTPAPRIFGALSRRSLWWCRWVARTGDRSSNPSLGGSRRVPHGIRAVFLSKAYGSENLKDGWGQ